MTPHHTRSARGRRLRVLLFDLDDTLYRVEAIPKLVKHRISEYMVTKLGLPADGIDRLTTELYLEHGTTLAGLVARGYNIDFDDWHRFVHYGAIPYSELLQRDDALRSVLRGIDLPKYVVTNGDRRHAGLCLAALGIADCFEGVFDFEFFQELASEHNLYGSGRPGVLCKPLPAALELLLRHLGGIPPSEAALFDDSIRNCAGAHGLGMLSVLVGSTATAPPPGADVVMPDCLRLPGVLPELFDRPGDHLHEALEHMEEPVAVQVQA